ncbi:formyl transferase [Crassisporium funariophilum]|nr:formyl transferase [Crassisporium funariophilum]
MSFSRVLQQRCLRLDCWREYSRHAPKRWSHNAALASKFRVVFLGRDEFSCLVLRELFEAKDVWEDIAIATQPDANVGRRGSTLSVSPLKLLGETLNLPVHTIPDKKPDFKRWKPPNPFTSPSSSLDPPPPNHLLITASFGRILTAAQLDLFPPIRRLNVHPSLLPSYRGPAPIQHTLINGEKESGVCVIQMLKKSQGIDAGAIWGLTEQPVPPNATFADLRDVLGMKGGRLLVSVLREMIEGKATPQPQPPADGLPFGPMISTGDALIEFSTMSAETITRRYRALSHQKPLFTHLSTAQTLQLHDLSPANTPTPALGYQPGSTIFSKATNSLLIRCAQDSVLSVLRVKPEGRRLMAARDWWNGLREVHRGKDVVLGSPSGFEIID